MGDTGYSLRLRPTRRRTLETAQLPEIDGDTASSSTHWVEHPDADKPSTCSTIEMYDVTITYGIGQKNEDNLNWVF